MQIKKAREIKMLRFSHVERLPRANNYLLHHLLFILNKVAENHEVGFGEYPLDNIYAKFRFCSRSTR